MYRAVHVTKSEANKILVFDSASYSFYLLCNGFIFDEKDVFNILTAFSSFTENASIYFEHKHLKKT